MKTLLNSYFCCSYILSLDSDLYKHLRIQVFVVRLFVVANTGGYNQKRERFLTISTEKTTRNCPQLSLTKLPSISDNRKNSSFLGVEMKSKVLLGLIQGFKDFFLKNYTSVYKRIFESSLCFQEKLNES